jgi:hypothetical protein
MGKLEKSRLSFQPTGKTPQALPFFGRFLNVIAPARRSTLARRREHSKKVCAAGCPKDSFGEAISDLLILSIVRLLRSNAQFHRVGLAKTLLFYLSFFCPLDSLEMCPRTHLDISI